MVAGSSFAWPLRFLTSPPIQNYPSRPRGSMPLEASPFNRLRHRLLPVKRDILPGFFDFWAVAAEATTAHKLRQVGLGSGTHFRRIDGRRGPHCANEAVEAVR